MLFESTADSTSVNSALGQYSQGAGFGLALVRGDWPHNLSQQHVIRSLEDVIAALPVQDRPQDAAALKALSAVWANVNWKERMLIVVPGMDLPDPLCSASLNGVSVRGKDVIMVAGRPCR